MYIEKVTNKYTNSLIYVLKCKDLTTVHPFYLGSTIDLHQRTIAHRGHCKRGNKAKVYEYIRAHGGFDNWEMLIVYYYPCNNRVELEREEEKARVLLGATLNSQQVSGANSRSIEYYREYREKNKEKIKEYQRNKSKEYREKRKQEKENLKK